jgi:hypothetical protein
MPLAHEISARIRRDQAAQLNARLSELQNDQAERPKFAGPKTRAARLVTDSPPERIWQRLLKFRRGA